MSGTAPDGSPVELYARMPTFGEAELVHDVLPRGTDILELGAGAGRMTHRLVGLGHPVTAVDESAEMLAETSCSSAARAVTGMTSTVCRSAERAEPLRAGTIGRDA